MNETTNGVQTPQVSGAAMVAAPLGPLQMEQGYLSTVARSEEFPDDPACRFYWGRVEAAANGSDPNLAERYRQLFLAAPALLAAAEAILVECGEVGSPSIGSLVTLGVVIGQAQGKAKP